ncbi:TIGR03557 family F420-dependent LLM class oxidoreductase [Myceligenerans sp. I2]|uniref:TIGR03557 family F420-dependent LLM class oxidoreductase n=2 Tax=Myceligenerans indicum TaxID=2593663 RepID=A0ABS1LLX0_9MICO|nr:TIGR03557 family F420-dependent LLM class oxidoreductase [Myceligenerans indicum]
MLETLHPRDAVELAVHAQEHGFSGVMATDRFQPWTPRQGHAGFVWDVLGALGERTTGDLGPVAVPGSRMHPAVLAQASATLAAMNPGRHWLGVASGDAVDEHVTGDYWPEAPGRIARLFEAVEIVRKLFAAPAGRDVRFSGHYFRLEATRLWTVPEAAPEVLVATGGPVTARRAGRQADGLITMAAPPERLQVLLDRFAAGAREAGKDPDTMPKVVQVPVSWAPDLAQAEENVLANPPIGAARLPRSDLRSPHDVAAVARLLRAEDLAGRVLVSADLAAHAKHLQRLLDLGFDRLYVHDAGPDARAWIDAYAAEVLPALTR